MNSMLCWYQRKIGAYDLQIWERALEIQEQQDGGMKSMDKRSSSVRPDLIDIDLVRGSTFSKNKPQYSWLAITCHGFIRIMLLPFFYKWWKEQSSRKLALLFLFLYFLHGVTAYFYICGIHDEFKNVPTSEVLMPIIIMMILGCIHCHVVSTNFRPYGRSDTRKNKQKRTLSSALLEPVSSASHQITLSFITSSVQAANGSVPKKFATEPDSSISEEEKYESQLIFDSSHTAEKESQVVIGRQRKMMVVPEMKENKSSENDFVNSYYDANNCADSKGNKHAGSDGEGTPNEKNGSLNENSKTEEKFKHKRQARSEILWEELHSTSSGSDTSLTDCSDEDSSNGSDTSSIGRLKNEHSKTLPAAALLPCANHGVDRISVKIWERNQCKKVQASLLDIGSIIRRKVQKVPVTIDVILLGICFSLIIAYVPTLFRIFTHQDFQVIVEQPNKVTTSFTKFFNNINAIIRSMVIIAHGESRNLDVIFVIYVITMERFIYSFMLFFMLAAALRTFRQRFLFAKFFSHLTSSRRAKKSDLPHFRLDKVENVRFWLSLRSYLRRRGPQRSVDVIVSSAFFISLFLLCFISIQLLHDTEIYISSLIYWEMTVWLLALAIFLLNFMTLGAQINRKYRNISILLTEQINLYLQMKQKPHKKEELQRANGVLSLAVKLIKEIETPFNIYGLAMNPLLYNITRVVVLSAFSGVISEILGFKLKIWKIKP